MNKKTVKIGLLLTGLVTLLALIRMEITEFHSENPLTSPSGLTTATGVVASIENQDTTDTKKALGFESKYGDLPRTLIGTELETQLRLDSEGNLLITDDIQAIFDYFLSAVEEESLDIVLARIQEYLNHHLDSPALEQAQHILSQYIALKSSLQTLESDMASLTAAIEPGNMTGAQYAELLRIRLDQRNALRAQYLDPEVYQAFYADEETYDEYTHAQLVIKADETLSKEEREQQLNELTLGLPEHMQSSLREAQIADELRTKTQALIKQGAGHDEIRALRKEMFGEEAAQRFDELDAQRAAWQTRLEAYFDKRDAILTNRGLDETEQNVQVNALLDDSFDDREKIRVKAYERSRDKS